ncbi:hypothetical protein K2173_018173 [Erythroxylum novogranatense]|uniref:Neprosin PEP catalytic domain-containing protein n=1 Tax=Erythroxylum novogranatense TaxID=1862640 RepID=A0AAV8TN13_9ROSI|nr:hypothetical protein K2173_018173 [Erythroxylum novogranatense]
MDLREMLAVLLLWFLSLSIDGVRGVTLSREEDLELEKQIKLLNKPAIKTLLTKDGEQYDCVDFYEQPGFDHPSLKNHKYEYKMNVNASRGLTYKDSSSFLNPKNIWKNGKGCPMGTVPIKRTTKDDLIRAKQAAEVYQARYRTQTPGNPGVHYSVVQMDKMDGKYYGGGMWVTLWNPPVEGSQFSGAHVMVRNGIESIEAGWMVNPGLYGDTQTRLFTYTNAGNSHCFNTYCPGYIIDYPDIPIDYVFKEVSRRGHVSVGVHYFIQRDKLNGNWFFQIGPDSTEIGFWPEKIFTSGLGQVARDVEWGGEVYSPIDQPSPPMGSGGNVFQMDTTRDASCQSIKYIDENYNIVEADTLRYFLDAPGDYLLKDLGHKGPEFGRLILWGGEGGYVGE